jgi:hypothetical protein
MKNWQMGSLLVLLVSALVVAVVVGTGQRTPKSEEPEDTREVPVRAVKEPASKPKVSDALKQKATALGLARAATLDAAKVVLGRMGSILEERWALFPEGRSDFFVHVSLSGEGESFLTGYRWEGKQIERVFKINVEVGLALYNNPLKIKSVDSVKDYLNLRVLTALDGEGDYESYLKKPLRLIEYQFNPMNDVYTVTHLPSMKEELLNAGESGLPTSDPELDLLQKPF